MTIEFLTQNDPLYILPFFDEFVRNYAREFTIARISCCRTMGKRPRLKLLREMISLYGILGVMRLLCTVLQAQVLGKLPRDRYSRRFYSLEQLAKGYCIPYQKIENPNATEFVESAKQRSADIIVSVACPHILKNALLLLPPRGCVNIHHAPLPRYKGMMPTFWQMFHGEKVVGITVHVMAAKVDEGTALLQESIAIQPGEALHSLIRRSKRYGAHCMARVLHQIESNSETPVPLDTGKSSYFSFPTKTEIREFHNRGLRAI